MVFCIRSRLELRTPFVVYSCLGCTNCMPAYSPASTSGLSKSNCFSCCVCSFCSFWCCCCCSCCCALNSVSLGLLAVGDATGSSNNVGAETVRCAGVAGNGVIGGMLCVCVNGSRRKSFVACLRCILAAFCWLGEVSGEIRVLRLLLCDLLELKELVMSLL